MICIIAGSRNATKEQVYQAISDSGFAHEITKVFSGCADGADKFGEMWARENGRELSLFPAPWIKYGKAAGPMRNSMMVNSGADALIAVWVNQSKGTADVIGKAKAKGLRVFVAEVAA